MRILVVAVAVAFCACANDDGIGPPDHADAERIAPRLGVAAIAVGVAGQGAGFLDNFLPCGRRGIINFHSTTPNTRRATFSGCNLGDSVVVDGVADVYWSGTRNQPLAGPTSVQLEGDLVITVSGRRSVVREITISNVQFPDQFANIFRLRTDSLRIETAGQSVRATNAHAARGLFDPAGLTSDAIPAVALSDLSEADLKRIVFDAGITLAWYMAINVRAEDPGPIVVQTACGLTHIHWDAQLGRTQFRQEWQNCRLFGGMLVSGMFEMRMPGPLQPAPTLQLAIDGPLVLAGTVPVIGLTRLDWSITLGAFPGNKRISGVLATATQQRQFSYDVYIDD